MAYVYIRHKNDRSLLLSCDENYTPLAERHAGINKPRSKAFYVGFPGGFAGVYASPDGPTLFVNADKHLFHDPSWDVSVRKMGKNNQVSFTGLAQGPLTFEYPVVELDPLDPWSEEAFDDFFIWLAAKRNDQEFIQMWTDKV